MHHNYTRANILCIAQTWIDTPYQHQASVRGAGTDCLGLIRGIWRELYGGEPETPPSYTPNWGDISGDEQLLSAASRWLTSIPRESAVAGDVLLFRMHTDGPCKHIGVMSAPDRVIHAYWGKAVVESFLVPFWQRRWTHSFAFPDINERDL